MDEIFSSMEGYGLTEYAIHAYLGAGKARSCSKGLGINIAQKIGSALYASVKKAVFAGTRIRFRKHGQTDCIEDKRAASGIIYKPGKGAVSFMGMDLKLEPVRRTDAYMMEALAHRVKYCRLKREPYGRSCRWFVQACRPSWKGRRRKSFSWGRVP